MNYSIVNVEYVCFVVISIIFLQFLLTNIPHTVFTFSDKVKLVKLKKKEKLCTKKLITRFKRKKIQVYGTIKMKKRLWMNGK